MPGGDINRLHPRSRAQNRPDNFSSIIQRRPATPLGRNLAVLPDKSGLGNSNGGNIKQNPDMTCNTESSGMSYPLPITKQQLRDVLQPPKCDKQRRQFPERQQPGHVREAGRFPDQRRFAERERGKVQHRNSGTSGFVLILKPHVQPRDQVHRFQPINRFHPLSEPVLQRNRLFRGEFPGMFKYRTGRHIALLVQLKYVHPPSKMFLFNQL